MTIELKLCNCAGCGVELLGESCIGLKAVKDFQTPDAVRGRINGRPYCSACLGSESKGQSLAQNLTPRQRAKLTHTGG